MGIIFEPPTGSGTVVEQDHWSPRIHPGYFYIQDRKHFLFARKKCVTLRDATVLTFDLQHEPVHNTVSVLFGGYSHSYYDVRGHRVLVKMDRLEDYVYGEPPNEIDWWEDTNLLYCPDTSIVISYTYLSWDDVNEEFDNVSITERFRIKDGRVSYQLTEQSVYNSCTGFIPEPPVGDAPVVITDDSIVLTDERDFALEYKVDPITAQIGFNTNPNLLLNPSFEADASGYLPHLWYWYLNGTAALTTPGYHGGNCVALGSAGSVQQLVGIDPLQTYTATARVRGTGTAQLEVEFQDVDGVILESTVTGVVFSGADWTDFSIRFGEDSDQTDETVYPTPTGAFFASFTVLGDGSLQVDAAQIEEGYDVSNFDPLSPLMTIEYETEAARPYIPQEDFDSRFGLWPTDPTGVHPVDLNNVNSRECHSYLVAEEFSVTGDLFLGCGGWVSGYIPTPSGVSDMNALPYGLRWGRKHLPYARISGWNKLRNLPNFHRPNQARNYDVSRLELANSPQKTSLQLGPTSDTWVDANNDLCMSVISYPDYYKELEFFAEDQREMPGFSHRISVRALNGSVIPSSSWTDESGGARFTYYPPVNFSGYIPLPATGEIDEITASGSATEVIKVFSFLRSGVDYTDYYGYYPFDRHPTLLEDILCYYTLDENNSTRDVEDSAGSQNGTLYPNTITTQDRSVPAIVNRGLDFQFPATNDYIDITGVENYQGEYFDDSKPFSVAAWIWRDIGAGLNERPIVCSTGGVIGNRGWMFHVWQNSVGPDPNIDKVGLWLMSNGWNNIRYVVTTNVAPADAWCFVVATYDGSGTLGGLKIYFDGVDETNTGAAGLYNGFSQPTPTLGIGGAPGGVRWHNGRIDEVGIWSRVLTQDEVTWLYADGAGRTY